MPFIAPSLLSADLANIEQAARMLEQSAADWLHFDVMDGVFVPNISFGLPVLAAVRPHFSKPIDVHLMIANPGPYIEAFAKAGADHISVHCETCPHLHRTIQQIKATGCQAGVAINPHTPVTVLEDILTDIDLVLLMSVNPGFGGQKFIGQSLNKLKKLKKMLADSGSNHVLIEIDGGVNGDNAAEIAAAGADALVAGNYVFSAEKPQERIKQLKAITQQN